MFSSPRYRRGHWDSRGKMLGHGLSVNQLQNSVRVKCSSEHARNFQLLHSGPRPHRGPTPRHGRHTGTHTGAAPGATLVPEVTVPGLCPRICPVCFVGRLPLKPARGFTQGDKCMAINPALRNASKWHLGPWPYRYSLPTRSQRLFPFHFCRFESVTHDSSIKAEPLSSSPITPWRL